MKNIFKLIFLFSLIINSLSADSCSSITDQTQCKDECQWVAAITKACEAIDDVMTVECGNAADGTACAAIKSGSDAVCEMPSTTCVPKTSAISGLCTNAVADESTCTKIKSGDTVLCEFTPASPDKCITKPVQFGATTIKLKSVKGKAVVITLEPAAADKDKKVTADTTIQNLQLNSGSSFTKDLTCKIASGSKLGDVDCTMDTAATKDTKYKLKAKSTVTYKGNDSFGTVTVIEDEVTATEDTSPSDSPDNNSSYMKISAFFTFLFLLF
jgi:hypothetical protein